MRMKAMPKLAENSRNDPSDIVSRCIAEREPASSGAGAVDIELVSEIGAVEAVQVARRLFSGPRIFNQHPEKQRALGNIPIDLGVPAGRDKLAKKPVPLGLIPAAACGKDIHKLEDKRVVPIVQSEAFEFRSRLQPVIR